MELLQKRSGEGGREGGVRNYIKGHCCSVKVS